MPLHSMGGMVEALGIYTATLVAGVLTGLIPVLNGELFLLGVVRLCTDDAAGCIALGILMAFGQMIAKVFLYQAARKATNLGRGRFAEKLRLARTKVERWRNKPLTITFVSAVFGLPPFYLVTLAAGILEIRFVAFLWLGIVGRLIRFISLALIISYV